MSTHTANSKFPKAVPLCDSPIEFYESKFRSTLGKEAAVRGEARASLQGHGAPASLAARNSYRHPRAWAACPLGTRRSPGKRTRRSIGPHGSRKKIAFLRRISSVTHTHTHTHVPTSVTILGK